MSNYIKLFNTHNEYTAFTQTEEFVKPNVSHCITENEVHYNPLLPPIWGTVDLGLSVKWARMNVGATSETDYGLYFAWGETDGYTADQVSGTATPHKDFIYADYELSSGGSTPWINPKLTKYCPTGKGNGYYADGFTGDTLVTLESVDDAAYAASNGQYRMPTESNWIDLCSGTTNGFVSGTTFIPYTWNDNYVASTGASSTVSELGKFNGVNGVLFWGSGSNMTDALSSGEYLFLPACGAAEDGVVNGVGQWGIHWSSSLNETLPESGWHFAFDTVSAALGGNGYRSSGYSVRGVLNQ